MSKERATRDAISDESCNKVREHKGKGRRKKISKPLNRTRAMKESIELDHQTRILKSKTSMDYRRQTNDEEGNIKDY